MDSADYITLMLMDKGYYDYDYEAPKQIKRKKTYEESRKSDKEVRDMLRKFGWGKKHTAEQLQAEVLEEERKKQAARR